MRVQTQGPRHCHTAAAFLFPDAEAFHSIITPVHIKGIFIYFLDAHECQKR